MGYTRTETRRTADWIEYEVVDDANYCWVERDDLVETKVVNTVKLTEPARKDQQAPKKIFAEKPVNPFVVRVPSGPRFSFGHQAEKALYRGLILGGAAGGAVLGLFHLLAKAVF